MKTNVELTYDELFLLEMAVDEVLWKLDVNSPIYQRYHRLNEMLYAQRIRLHSRYEKGDAE
jgi:hypothetical protein